MKNTFFFFLFFLILSCNTGDVSSEIARLEQLHLDQPTTEVKQQLIDVYQKFLPTKSDDHAVAAETSNKLATLQMDLNQYEDAAKTLEAAIKNHSTGTATFDNIRMLATLYMDRIYLEDQASAFQNFGALFPDMASMKTHVNNIITDLKNTMFNETTSMWDRKKATDYISLCRLYAGIDPADERSQEHIFKAANISANPLKKYDKALDIYDFILNNGDKFDKAPTALFMKGFIHDENLKKYDEAKLIYEEFLEKYPDNVYAESAKSSLATLGMSAAEIIESFEKKKQ